MSRPALKVAVNPLPWMFAESGWILNRQPRRGAVDLNRVITALPEGFVGGVVMEVDVANLPTRMESARAGMRYLKAYPAFVVSQS